MVMNCLDAQFAIQAAVLSGAPLGADYGAHITSCEQCQQSYADAALDHALQSEQVPAPRARFVDEVIATAVRNGRRTQSPLPAIAASIAVIGLMFAMLYGMPRNPASPQVTLIAHEGKTVRVLIDSPSAQQAATVTIELADNLELAGFPNERRIEWQTDLSVGKNLLPLPLTLTEKADTHFDVALSYGSTRKNIRVSVRSA
jgi:hypothetical protein